MSSHHRTALVYDFDGTLARGNVQEHSFIPEIGLSKEDFWSEVKRRTKHHDADEILVYMHYMLEAAFESGHPITREALEAHGKSTPLFDGLDTWFERINEYGARQGLEIEHYIISSGNLEFIRGSEITQHFRQIFASKFMFDEDDEAIGPALAINYTNKTQYLFRINKGIDNAWDNDAVNRWIPLDDRPVPFNRMIFFGDGATDIPSMKMVRHQGGCSIAVFDPEAFSKVASQDKIHRLIAEDRVHYVAPADYSEGSQLEVITKGALGRIAREAGSRSG
ncbi:HAD family hydrolase [Gaopeijia maritima]|uniref:Haloacid dehalogenase-like hydrolase n=1 Tax=Gaopeijia maritima TaxID=3119007 RepID=A0ABU9EAD2_9BACT